MEAYAVVELAHRRAERLSKVLLWITVGLVGFVLALMVLMWYEKGSSKHVVAWTIATVFVLLAVPISSLDIRNHLQNFEVPEFQKFIVRILFMVPVYSVTCWMCLSNEKLYTALESLRSLYEAFVIWSFTYFLMAYLGPDQETIAMVLSSKRQESHIFPVNFFLREWKMGHEFLNKCKAGTLQYVVWKILNVPIVLLASLLGIYGDSEWRPDRVYIYVVGITNCSQMLAIYCLVLFYKATAFDLKPIKPLAKFLCIKAVVFFSFWQGCLVSGLVYFDIIHPSKSYFDVDVNTYAKALQDFIICIEMLFFAIAHHYVFSYKDFKTYGDSGVFATIDTQTSASSYSSGGRRPLFQALLEAANPRDLVHDIRHNIRRIRKSGGSFSSNYDDDSDGSNHAVQSSAALKFDAVPTRNLDSEEEEGEDGVYSNNESALTNSSDAQLSLMLNQAEAKAPRDVL